MQIREMRGDCASSISAIAFSSEVYGGSREENASKHFEHDPEKACPALDAGWIPVFRKDHAQTKGKAKAAVATGNRSPRYCRSYFL
jgi:hypothetical protein